MKVIKASNLPTRLPFVGTIALWLLLDRTNAPQWIWGSLGVLVLVAWVGSIVSIFKEDQVDIFKEKV